MSCEQRWTVFVCHAPTKTGEGPCRGQRGTVAAHRILTYFLQMPYTQYVPGKVRSVAWQAGLVGQRPVQLNRRSGRRAGEKVSAGVERDGSVGQAVAMPDRFATLRSALGTVGLACK